MLLCALGGRLKALYEELQMGGWGGSLENILQDVLDLQLPWRWDGNDNMSEFTVKVDHRRVRAYFTVPP